MRISCVSIATRRYLFTIEPPSLTAVSWNVILPRSRYARHPVGPASFRFGLHSGMPSVTLGPMLALKDMTRGRTRSDQL